MHDKPPEQLMAAVEKAASFHGHLGPFLVIGVRMGLTAINRLLHEAKDAGDLQASLKVPFRTPFSCIIDGVQSTTRCTVGNRRLKLQESQPASIAARFWLRRSQRKITISVRKSFVERLEKELSSNLSDPRLQKAVLSVAAAPEERLFIVRGT